MKFSKYSGKIRMQAEIFSNHPAIIHRRSGNGMTVVEFLIGFTVIAVILLFTAPGVSFLLQNRYLENTAVDLASSLALAKSEAERRHSTVRLCPSSNGTSCRQDGDWNKGWLVFSDGNADGTPQEIERIRSYGPAGEKIRIRASGVLADAPAFTVAGITSNNQLNRGEFTVCLVDSGSSSRKVIVEQDGWARLVKDDGANCPGALSSIN